MATGAFGCNVSTGQREGSCVVVEGCFHPIIRSMTHFTIGRELGGHMPFGIVVLNLVARDTFGAGRSCVSNVAIGTLHKDSMTAGQLKSGGGMFKC